MYNKNKKNNSATSNNSREEINVALVGPVGCGKSGKFLRSFFHLVVLIEATFNFLI
jgi:hypothetical protein